MLVFGEAYAKAAVSNRVEVERIVLGGLDRESGSLLEYVTRDVVRARLAHNVDNVVVSLPEGVNENVVLARLSVDGSVFDRARVLGAANLADVHLKSKTVTGHPDGVRAVAHSVAVLVLHIEDSARCGVKNVLKVRYRLDSLCTVCKIINFPDSACFY